MDYHLKQLNQMPLNIQILAAPPLPISISTKQAQSQHMFPHTQT